MAERTARWMAWSSGAVLLGLLLLPGCVLSQAPPSPPWVNVHDRAHDSLGAAHLRRILIVPFGHEEADPDQAFGSTEACRIALQNFSFGEVLVAAEGEFDLALKLQDPWRGEVPVDLLVDARRRYFADTVLVGKVTLCREYGEPALGWQLRLYETVRGRMLWLADDVIDCHLPEVRSALASFRWQEGVGSRAYTEDPSLVPFDAYARFVALSFIAPLHRAVQPPIVAAGPQANSPKLP